MTTAPPSSSPVTQRQRSSWGPGPRWLPLLLPLLVAAGVLTMTALSVSGSSVEQILGPDRQGESVSLGASRSIRSDEWNVRTPLVAGQAARGLPDRAEVGVGDHDMSVLYDLPTADPASLLRPNLWGYWILPLDHAFAFDWWSLAAILIVGVYTLVLVLTRDWRWAAVAAVVAYASPFFHWWYLGLSLALVGWAALGTGLFLYSVETPNGGKRWLAATGAGAAFAALVTTAYPPFQIPVILVLGAVAIGYLISGVTAGRIQVRSILVNAILVGGIVAVAAAAYLLSNADALSAISSTVYPGDRRAVSGTGRVQHLGTAWFGWLYVRDPGAMGGVILPNASEASSFLALGVFLLAALPPVWRQVAGPGAPLRWPIVGAVTALILMLVHAFVGLPGVASRLLLLDRVQPDRAIVGTGLASLLVLTLVGVALQRTPPEGWRRLAAGAILTTTVLLVVAGVGQTLRNAGAPMDRSGILLTAAVAAVVAASWFWRPLISLAALGIVGLVVAVPANPIQVGLGPLTPDTLVEDLRAAADVDGGTWLSTDPRVSTVLTANGIDNLSGVNLYPNVEAWRVLDPAGRYEDVWNRYAHTIWVLDASRAQVTMEALTPDEITISISPCDPGLLALGLTQIATGQPLDAPCLTLDRRTTSPTGERIYLYDVRSEAIGSAP